jgi:predicted transcriptional regulator
MRQPSGATGDVFVVSAGGAPLVAVRMKNKLSSMIVFHRSFTHLIHDSLRFRF